MNHLRRVNRTHAFSFVLLCICIVAFCVISASAATYSGKCGDNLTYTLNTNTGVLTISGTGAMADWSDSNGNVVPWYSYRSSIRTVQISKAATSIGAYAFYGCSSLTSITIPNRVTSIGASAFRGCSSLTSISIPSGVTSIGDFAFFKCSGLNAVYITDIAAWCGIAFGDFSASPFYYAQNLYLNGEQVTDLVIPDSVTSIGAYAFYNCSRLTSISIPSGVTSIGYSAFFKCSSLTSISIPSGVTSIGGSAFRDCSSLTSITIPNRVTSIGDFAFKGCSSLTSISIPSGVTSIWAYAFYDCSSLTSISIPDSVTSIWAYAFYNCGSLTSISIPSGVTSIGAYAFYNCGSLTSISIPSGVTSIERFAFYGCGSLASITIPDSVTSIGGSAFYNCSSLTSISIPSGVTSIGEGAFSGCSNLTSITILNPDCQIDDSQNAIPSTATIYGYTGSTAAAYAVKYGRTFVSIGESCGDKLAFRMDLDTGVLSITGTGAMDSWYFDDSPWYTFRASIRSVQIASGATSIGDFAFDGCSNLVDVVIAETVERIGDGAFDNCTSLAEVTIFNGTCKIPDRADAFPASVTIHGYAGSTAEAYAKKYNCAFAQIGHTHIYAEDYTVDVPASCTTAGAKSRHCTVEGCTETIDITEIPAAGHKFGAWNVRTAAKCEETGVDYRVCAVCQQEETRTTAKLGHDYADAWTVDKAETCAAPGSKSHHCTRCDAVADVTEIPAAGHKFGAWTIIREATLDDTGERTHTCEVCGTTETETIPRRVRGDADGDGAVTIRDALLVLRAVLDGAAVNPYMDANGDGKLMLADVLLILRLAA